VKADIEQQLQRVLSDSATAAVPDSLPVPPRADPATAPSSLSTARKWFVPVAAAVVLCLGIVVTVTLAQNGSHDAPGLGGSIPTVTPRPSDVSGPIHWKAADGCPKSVDLAQVRGGVVNQGSGLSKQLLPTAASPNGVLICSYASNNESTPITNSQLVASTSLESTKASELGSVIRDISLVDHSDGAKCPAYSAGIFMVLIFSYESRPDIDLLYRNTGCESLSNGVSIAYETGNPSFYDGFKSAFERVAGAR